MSAPPADTADTADAAALQLLKQQAETQMRRPAPPLAGQPEKKRKLQQGQVRGADNNADAEDGAAGHVGRYAYAADGAIAAGSTVFSASCGYNRQRSAAKEMLSIIKPLLPEGTQLQMVKVGARGLAVVRVEPPAGAPPVPVTRIVQQVLEQIESGQLPHTKFCERIVPADTTCLMTASALEAALTRAVTSYLAAASTQQQQQPEVDAAVSGGGADDAAGADADAASAVPQQQQQQQPLQYAVVYKSRGVDQQILAELEKEEAEARQAAAAGQEQEAAAADTPAADTQQQQQGLDRARVINIAAAVMDKCCQDTGGVKVNLTQPQVVLMVEVLPLPNQQTAGAVSVIPAAMITGSSHNLKVKAIGALARLHAGGGGGGKPKGQQQQQKGQQPKKKQEEGKQGVAKQPEEGKEEGA